MSKELHEAAERYGEYRAFVEKERASGFDGVVWPYPGAMSDALSLADAYLSERDPTPLTEDWLRSVGATDMKESVGPSGTNYALRLGPAQWYEFASGGELLIDHHGGFAIKTRGDLRRLASALGISLKESP